MNSTRPNTAERTTSQKQSVGNAVEVLDRQDLAKHTECWNRVESAALCELVGLHHLRGICRADQDVPSSLTLQTNIHCKFNEYLGIADSETSSKECSGECLAHALLQVVLLR